MDISILGFKLNLEVLILIGIVYLILAMHTVCGCASIFGKREGMDNNLTQPIPAPALSNETKKKEGFVGANTNYGESASYPMIQSTYLDASKWGTPNLTIFPGKPVPAAAQAIINRPNQTLPLPEGQLSLFDNMPFSPECCPNTYSSSMGCACMNSSTYNYLITRGNNNVPYSEY
jgi:hypothetical protein